MGEMKAVRKINPGEGFTLTKLEVPKPKRGELLIEVQATSVCGTDIHIYHWDPPWPERMKLPKTMGHEVAGKVIEIGEGVTRFAVDDRISAESHIACGYCIMCKTGNMHICKNLKFFSIDTDGFWAKYAIIPEQNAWKNPPSLPPEIATLQESMGNSVYTVTESHVQGKEVAVFGSGPTGLFATAIAKAMGATKVMVVVGSKTHAKIARKMGADILIERHSVDPVTAILEETDAMGVDVALEMSGNDQALQQAFKVVRQTGQVSILGLPTKSVSLDISKDIVLKDITIRGIYGRKMWSTWLTTSRLLHSGRIDISPVITHKLKLEDFQKGIEAMKSGESGKVVFLP